MKRVFKYEKSIGDIVIFDLSFGAKILRVDVQKDDGSICLWALVDPELNSIQQRFIRVAGTGHPITESPLKYINTFTMYNRSLWFHAFEILED